MPINRLSTLPISPREIPALGHETIDDTVEFGAFVSVAVSMGRELPKIPRGERDDVVVQLEDHAACGLAADGDVELRLD